MAPEVVHVGVVSPGHQYPDDVGVHVSHVAVEHWLLEVLPCWEVVPTGHEVHEVREEDHPAP